MERTWLKKVQTKLYVKFKKKNKSQVKDIII